MKTRSITLNLPEDLIRRAKVHAAEQGSSVNAVVRELLEDAFIKKDRSLEAAERFLQIARRNPNSTFDPGSMSREEMHERR